MATKNPDYEAIAAGQTGVPLGSGAGAAGDYIAHVVIVPTTTSPGAISVIDGSTSITIFAGGASSLQSLAPFTVPLMMYSRSGPWSLTTGANVSAIAVGNWSV